MKRGKLIIRKMALAWPNVDFFCYGYRLLPTWHISEHAPISWSLQVRI